MKKTSIFYSNSITSPLLQLFIALNIFFSIVQISLAEVNGTEVLLPEALPPKEEKELSTMNCPPLLNHDLEVLHSDKKINPCQAYTGKVILVVNTASKCGFTPQFEGLEALYKNYQDRGLVILGFPSNDFFQEKVEEEEIASFCRLNYGVTFPMFSKIHVRGKNAHPFYKDLISAADTSPKWNFYKYLIDRQGAVVEVFSSRVKPEDEKLLQKIEALLESK